MFTKIVIAIWFVLFTIAIVWALPRVIQRQEAHTTEVQDFPGLQQEIERIENSIYFEQVRFISGENLAGISGTASVDVTIRALERIHCTFLLDLASRFIDDDKYKLVVEASTTFNPDTEEPHTRQCLDP